MKNNTNIYDIDGELIRAAGDNHKISIEEARERAHKYKELFDNLPENDPKRAVYMSYMRNLTGYIMGLYSKMSPEELQAQIKAQATQKATEEEIEKALNELKEDASDELGGEYVDFEEVNDGQGTA